MSKLTGSSIQFRCFNTDSDLPHLIQLLTEMEEVDHTGEDINAETIKAQLQWSGHDPALDRWVAVTSNHEELMIGSGWVLKVPQNTYADVYVGVHPAWRRQGIGSELLQHIMTRAQALQPQNILASADIQHQEAIDFLRKRAFSPVAAYTAMRLASNRPLPQPDWPAGYTIRAYNPLENFSLLLDMYNRAFQDLWGHWEKVLADDLHGILEHEDAAGIFLLFTQTGEVVGTCRSEISAQLSVKNGKQTGYLDAPGVVPEHREQNLYLPQLLHATHWIRSQASQESIDIELESWGDRPQVLAAYQELGFEKVRQQDIYRWQTQ
jgi:mycothiol synthase